MRHSVFISLEKIQSLNDMGRRRPNRADLFDLATEQHGYFTAAQAARCGYASDMLTYHVKQGTFQRVHRGVYRFRDFPFSTREDLVAAWLAVGKDVAVVSHESALDLWDLSDVVPDAVHLTIPRARRSRARRPPPGVIIHTTARPWENGDVRSNGRRGRSLGGGRPTLAGLVNQK
jgi:predicted transcriptional regulator of viral defense system